MLIIIISIIVLIGLLAIATTLMLAKSYIVELYREEEAIRREEHTKELFEALDNPEHIPLDNR